MHVHFWARIILIEGKLGVKCEFSGDFWVILSIQNGLFYRQLVIRVLYHIYRFISEPACSFLQEKSRLFLYSSISTYLISQFLA